MQQMQAARDVAPTPGPETGQGLSGDEARQRLGEAGPNEPGTARRVSSIAALARFFGNPLVLILLLASGLYLFMLPYAVRWRRDQTRG